MTCELAEGLTQRYRPLSVSEGHEIFLRIEDALRMQDDAERLDLAALGFEGFELLPDGVRPRLDWIADFSPQQRGRPWSEYQRLVDASARRFLGEIPADLVVVPQYWSESEYDQRGYGSRDA